MTHCKRKKTHNLYRRNIKCYTSVTAFCQRKATWKQLEMSRIRWAFHSTVASPGQMWRVTWTAHSDSRSKNSLGRGQEAGCSSTQV